MGRILLNLEVECDQIYAGSGEVLLKGRKIVTKKSSWTLYKFEVRDTGIGMSGEERSVNVFFKKLHLNRRIRRRLVSSLEGTGSGYEYHKEFSHADGLKRSCQQCKQNKCTTFTVVSHLLEKES